MSTASASAERLGASGVEVLESIGQHRLLSTRQIHELHTPEASMRWTQGLLGRLRGAGFAAAVARPGGLLLWHLTESGADALEAIPTRAETRRRVITPEQAAGPLQEHTLAVNEVGVAFARAARERGDECGAFDWFNEIAHSLGPPPGRRAPEQLIADAVLTYLYRSEAGASVIYRFIELDRANRSAPELARRIARYARLYRREVPSSESRGATVALWQTLYPVFPSVLVVLAGRDQERLEVRRKLVLALCGQDAQLARTPEVDVSICLLAELVERGPFAPIFLQSDGKGEAANWLGESA